MKRILKNFSIFFALLIFNLFATDVYAASANISVKTNKSQAVVGDTIKVTITVSSSSALGAWEYDVKYDSSKLTYVSSNLEGGTHSVGYVGSSNVKNKSYTMTFKAKASGSTQISIANSEIASFTGGILSTTNGSASVKIITQKDLESSYSSDNNLSSLSVNGYSLNPSFDKNTTNYSLTVPNDVSSVTINAKASDSKARISGTGKVSLKEGNNKVNVVVTAENGNKKTYTINVTVKELNPITVKIGNEEYTVVRKKDNLTAPSTYTDAVAMINGEEVPAFRSSITNYLLVGLSDKDGNINLYIYQNDEYILYNEIKFSGIILQPITPSEDKMIEGLKQATIKKEDNEIMVYELEGLSYPLIYGVNVETGEENWYTYDSTENTLQKYVAMSPEVIENVTKVTEKSDKYKGLAIILGGISVILFLFMVVAMIKLARKKTEVG